MLEFLGKIANVANVVNKAAGPVQQILDAFKKPASQPQSLRDRIVDMSTNFPQSQAEAQAIKLLQSLGEPNNPLLKKLADEEFQNLRGAAQGDIRSKVLADRREQSMGRAPVFFDPERADENIAYQISRGTPMLRQQAQQNAIQRILQAAGVGNYAGNADARNQGNLNALASVYAMDTLQPNATGQQSTQMQTKMPGVLGRTQDGLNGLQKILEMFKVNQPQGTPPYFPDYTTLSNGDRINWNQKVY